MARRGNTRKHNTSPKTPQLSKYHSSIQSLEREIRNGRRGKPLTEQEITKLKNRIALLEHQAGIKHV